MASVRHTVTTAPRMQINIHEPVMLHLPFARFPLSLSSLPSLCSMIFPEFIFFSKRSTSKNNSRTPYKLILMGYKLESSTGKSRNGRNAKSPLFPKQFTKNLIIYPAIREIKAHCTMITPDGTGTNIRENT